MGSQKLRAIRTWHIRNARALDVARWYYHFEDGDVRAVLKALACYQNPDGGFGHGIEPDIRTTASSPIGTWSASLILREVGLPELAREMIHKMLVYLDASLLDNQHWAATTIEMNSSPHAPWWHFSPDNEFWGQNPTVELAAFVLQTADPERPLYQSSENILRHALDDLMSPDYAVNPHELANYARAGEILRLVRPDLLPPAFLPRMNELLRDTVTMDPAAYRDDEYLTTPTFFLDSPRSLYYPELKEIADFFCGYLEESIQSEGYWNVSWTWGDQPLHPDSLRDWRGSLIMENMLYLQHFKPQG